MMIFMRRGTLGLCRVMRCHLGFSARVVILGVGADTGGRDKSISGVYDCPFNEQLWEASSS